MIILQVLGIYLAVCAAWFFLVMGLDAITWNPNRANGTGVIVMIISLLPLWPVILAVIWVVNRLKGKRR